MDRLADLLGIVGPGREAHSTHRAARVKVIAPNPNDRGGHLPRGASVVALGPDPASSAPRERTAPGWCGSRHGRPLFRDLGPAAPRPELELIGGAEGGPRLDPERPL